MKKKIISLLLAVTMIASVATAVNAATQVDAGTVTLPANSWIIDGGFETAQYINQEDRVNMKTLIPTFTATEDNGNTTERPAKNAQIMTEEGFAVEGKQCLLLEQGENLTIKLPNLTAYKGATLVFNYYVRAKKATMGYGMWGRIDDRSIIEDVPVMENNEQKIDPTTNQPMFEKKAKVVYEFKDGFAYYDNPDNLDQTGKWTLLSEEIVVPDTVSDTSEYVFNFGCYGNALYFDAISCVVKTADGAEVNPSVFVEPTPSPTVEPTPDVDNPPTAVKVKFTKKSVKIKKGKKATLKVTIKGAKKATFSVDKKGKKVVKLSKKKAKSVVVTGKKKGKATITAKAAGKKATCKVTVK